MIKREFIFILLTFLALNCSSSDDEMDIVSIEGIWEIVIVTPNSDRISNTYVFATNQEGLRINRTDYSTNQVTSSVVSLTWQFNTGIVNTTESNQPADEFVLTENGTLSHTATALELTKISDDYSQYYGD